MFFDGDFREKVIGAGVDGNGFAPQLRGNGHSQFLAVEQCGAFFIKNAQKIPVYTVWRVGVAETQIGSFEFAGKFADLLRKGDQLLEQR